MRAKTRTIDLFGVPPSITGSGNVRARGPEPKVSGPVVGADSAVIHDDAHPYKAAPKAQLNPLIWALPLQALLLLSNLDLLDLWSDEWFTLITVPKPISKVVSAVAGNIHPPLYYVLLHYWTQLPWTLSPIASMRAMSAVWALVATVVVYFLWLRQEGRPFQAKFLALWALSP